MDEPVHDHEIDDVEVEWYQIAEESLERALKMRTDDAPLKRWFCPCGCTGYALYGWGSSRKIEDPKIKRQGRTGDTSRPQTGLVLWVGISMTVENDGTLRVRGLEYVDEVDQLALAATGTPVTDAMLIEVWLASGLGDALRSEFGNLAMA